MPTQTGNQRQVKICIAVFQVPAPDATGIGHPRCSTEQFSRGGGRRGRKGTRDDMEVAAGDKNVIPRPGVMMRGDNQRDEQQRLPIAKDWGALGPRHSAR